MGVVAVELGVAVVVESELSLLDSATYSSSYRSHVSCCVDNHKWKQIQSQNVKPTTKGYYYYSTTPPNNGMVTLIRLTRQLSEESPPRVLKCKWKLHIVRT
jgi:hypothetical protein